MCSLNRRHNIFEKSVLPKLMNWFSAIKIATGILQKSMRWITWKYKGPRIANIIWNKKMFKSWKTYPTWSQNWDEDRQADIYTYILIHQWNRRNSKNRPTHLVIWFSTKMPSQFNGECIIFSTNNAGKIAIYQNVNLNPYCIPYTKINSNGS